MKKLGLLFSVLIMSFMFALSASAVLTTSIELPATITVYMDEPVSLNPTFTPKNATDKSYTIIGSDHRYNYEEFILGGLLGTITKTDVCKFSDYIQVTDDNQLKGLKATVEPKTDKAFTFIVTVRANDGSGATAKTAVKVLTSRHKGVSFKAQRATCTQDGYKAGIKCEICGIILEGGETVPALGHDFSDRFTVDIAPTCTKQGVKSRHCMYCNEVKDVTPVDKIAHTYTANVIEPTCTQKGQTVYICSCGDRYSETIPAKGHSFSGSVCSDCGLNKVVDCSCKCHKKGLPGFFWKIGNFFNKLFKKNHVCFCGAVHY